MPCQHKIVIKKRYISIRTTFDFFKLIYQFKQNEKWKMKKKKIRTQNIHEFRSSFILNMNKKEYKSRKFNHNNTNLEKKNYRQETFLAFSYSYN